LGEIPTVTKKKKATTNGKQYEDMLRKYLRLDTDLQHLYKKWKTAHNHFTTNPNSEKFVTQLDQDVVENIFSFILSQNNNISRISLCVERLCLNFGEKICAYNDKDYYAFPTLEALTSERNSEEKLRELGLGYRAKYIKKTAEQIVEKGGLKYLESLKDMTYDNAHQELVKLTGIGPKVADCICLMSLNHLSAIPVDTHVIQIAKHYIPELDTNKLKSLNSTNYKKISDSFRHVYGDKAGWAQTHLFCNELVRFKKESQENDDNAKPKKKLKK
jgi:N-glycosylase/DNA lyase